MDEEKRPPGRPRLDRHKGRTKKEGIVDAPRNKQNCIELIYDNPFLFKKAMIIFKSMHSKEISFLFNVDEILIVAIDHLEQSHILVTINCKNAVSYFCDEPVVSVIDAKKFEKIMNVINKFHHKIIIRKDRTALHSNIIFELNDTSEIREIYTVKLITPSDDLSVMGELFDTSDHKISFSMEDKQFRSFICNTATLTDILTIRKLGSKEPLTFKHISDDKMILGKRIVDKPTKISLETNMPDDEIFTMSVKMNLLKPITASAPQPSEINVKLHDTKKMVCSYMFDSNFIHVQIATSIIL